MKSKILNVTYCLIKKKLIYYNYSSLCVSIYDAWQKP